MTHKSTAMEIKIRMAISRVIYETIKAYNTTQNELAGVLGISKARMSNLLHMSKNITIRTMCDIMGKLGRTVEIRFPVDKSGKDSVVVELLDEKIKPDKELSITETADKYGVTEIMMYDAEKVDKVRRIRETDADQDINSLIK